MFRWMESSGRTPGIFHPFKVCTCFFPILISVSSLNERGRIVLVGHSMGACLASIAAYQLVNRLPETKPKILVIPLGAPLFV